MVIRVGVNLVQLDAAVTDAMGRPITDLRLEDFNLEVDGRKQAITNSAYFGDLAQAGPAPAHRDPAGSEESSTVAKSSGDEDQDGVVVFVIDDLNLSAEGMHRARRALQGFARAGGVGRTMVAVRTTSDESPSFTLFRSSEGFARAVDALRFTLQGSQGRAGQMTTSDPGIASRGWSAAKFLQAPVINPSQDLANTEQGAFSLLTTINGLGSIPGRKAIVFVSEGFSLTQTPTLLGAGSPLGSLFGDSSNDAALRMITDVANRAFVVIYAADPRSMVVDFPGARENITADEARLVTRFQAPATQGEGSLRQLAAGTGGLVLTNRSNQLGSGLFDVMRDQRSYYLIGFEPPVETFARTLGKPAFHRIRLTVNRKETRVRTRAGFYGVTDQEITEHTPPRTPGGR